MFGAAHEGAVGVVDVVESAEVQIAVDEVKGELVAEDEIFFSGEFSGYLGADNDFSRLIEIGIGWKGDDVGGRWVAHELVMQLSDIVLFDEGYGELAGRGVEGSCFI